MAAWIVHNCAEIFRLISQLIFYRIFLHQASHLLRNIQLRRTSNRILECAMNNDQKDRNPSLKPSVTRLKKGG
jgi:hypothetical protein